MNMNPKTVNYLNKAMALFVIVILAAYVLATATYVAIELFKMAGYGNE